MQSHRRILHLRRQSSRNPFSAIVPWISGCDRYRRTHHADGILDIFLCLLGANGADPLEQERFQDGLHCHLVLLHICIFKLEGLANLIQYISETQTYKLMRGTCLLIVHLSWGYTNQRDIVFQIKQNSNLLLLRLVVKQLFYNNLLTIKQLFTS